MRLGVSDFILLLEKPTTYTHTPSHTHTHTHTHTRMYAHTRAPWHSQTLQVREFFSSTERLQLEYWIKYL